MTKKEKELLESLNRRAAIILEIEKHFRKSKVPIDSAYIDSLSDEKLEEIAANHCTPSKEITVNIMYVSGKEETKTFETRNIEWVMEQYQRNRETFTWGITAKKKDI
ncbi:MAG: hypothetical protein CMP57_03950 [Flavobacteriales bacterium]|nr:hypothetical protein [Flavobacteriales bacterium]|tara:strand:- start:6984 stop:7304 length:321 start_codon:yes stop_codon:yes gene_type:complete